MIALLVWVLLTLFVAHLLIDGNNQWWLVAPVLLALLSVGFNRYSLSVENNRLKTELAELEQMWEENSSPTMMTLEEVIRRTIQQVKEEGDL